VKIIISVIFIGFLLTGQAQNESLEKKIDSLVQYTRSIWYTDTDGAMQMANHVLDISKKQNYRIGEASGHNLLGVVYSNRGDFAESMINYKKGSDIFKELGDYSGFAKCQYNIGLLLQDDKQFEKALEHVNEAYLSYLKSGVRQDIAMGAMTLGNLYLTNHKGLDAAIAKMKESAAISRADGDTLMLCYALSLQGDAHVEYEGNLDTAIQRFSESIKLMKVKQPNNHWSLGFSYLGLSKAYLKNNELQKALETNDKALIEYVFQKQKLGFRNVYEIRKDIFERMGDYGQSVNAYKMLQIYSDSIYREESSQQVNRLQTEYQTEIKEAEIASLSQQASIQALEIQQKNQTIIIGLIAMFFVVVATYFVYKQREAKRKQSQTELEQRFLRSQLNPHFISNALVAVQSFMLKNDSESAALYLTKFSKLMREILENSRKEFIPVEEEISMLRNYLDIHKLRLGSFDFTIEIDENIDPEVDTIPPMFVQPFLENAIEHGIANIKEGKIELRFKKDGDYISIEVNDNGAGLTQNIRSEHTSLSSTIIQERMDLFNRTLKRKIKLIVDNLKNENGEISGTKVELKVPFSYI
jgi:tetratricopeptide (TPR) repeat protein